MLPRLLSAYEKHGYAINIGGAFSVSYPVEKSTGRPLVLGGAVTVSDIGLFSALSRLPIIINGWFIVGNAFGLSTFILAELFPSSLIDAIDAEVVGRDNITGSEITRKIAAEFFPNVSLTTGFSPADLDKAMRLEKYSGVFIDGLHTNEQIVLDFEGVMPRLADESMVIFHDVGLCRMYTGWAKCRDVGAACGFTAYEFPYTGTGSAILVRGFPAAQSLFNLSSGDLRTGNRHYFEGRSYSPHRPMWCHRTIYEHELKIRSQIRKAFPDAYSSLVNIVRQLRNRTR